MKLTADTITDDQIRALRETATVKHPPDDGERDDAWVCGKCGEPCGYSRKRPLYGHDMADAHCFTENCIGGTFCVREAFLQRVLTGWRPNRDRYDRNAVVQLAARSLNGESYARACCAEIFNARSRA